VGGKPRRLPLLALACSALAPPSTFAACTIGHVADLPVTMTGLRPMVHAAINGKEVLFIADTGAFYSSITQAAATQLGLHLQHAPPGYNIQGFGGTADTYGTIVKDFTLLNLTFHNAAFFVLGNELDNGAAGLLGENLFYQSDVEYDLTNGMIRLFRPKNCKNVNFAYWSKETGQPVSRQELEFSSNKNPHIVSFAEVNGVRIKVLLDTGADASMLSLDTAKRAGITLGTPGVRPAGKSGGIGPHTVSTWIAPVASFKFGDEEIKNTHLRLTESLLGGGQGDMLLGIDFFLSHRLFVSNSEQQIFFTYNGGPVFNLTIPAESADAAPPRR